MATYGAYRKMRLAVWLAIGVLVVWGAYHSGFLWSVIEFFKEIFTTFHESSID